jgi:hypothetical protein
MAGQSDRGVHDERGPAPNYDGEESRYAVYNSGGQ